MIDFRKELDAQTRFEARDKIFDIINKGSKDYADISNTLKELEEAVAKYVSASDEKPESLIDRKNKVIAISLLRDFKYAHRKYPFLKGLGYSGLLVENYKSADKLNVLA